MVERLAAAMGLDPVSANALKVAAGFAPDPPAMVAGNFPCDDRTVRAAFEAAVALQTVTSLSDATDLAGRALGELGIHRFTTGTLRMQARRAEIRLDPVGKPAVGWMNHCVVQRYRDTDPFVKRTASGWGPFLWSDVIAEGLSEAALRIVDEARDFGIGGGFVLPLRHPDGSVRALTSWTESSDAPDPAFRPAARLIGSALLDAVERLAGHEQAQDAPPSLNPGSRAILGWMAAGRDLCWIGRRTATTEPEVLRAIAEACVDMGAADPLQAITRAAALELIST